MSGALGALVVEYLPQVLEAALSSGIPQELVSGAIGEMTQLVNRGAIFIASESSLASTIQAAAAQETGQ